MNRGRIYLSIEDLMKLIGTKNRSTAYSAHKTIREALKPGKMNLTIREYCEYTGDGFEEIWRELRE